MRLVIVVAVIVLSSVVGAGGIGWYIAGRIESDALAVDDGSPEFDLSVTDIGEGTITLRPTEIADLDHGDWRQPGTYGLVSADAHGIVGEILRRNGNEVTRELLSLDSSLTKGDRVRLSSMVFSGDPLSARGLAFDEVVYQSDVGKLGAWLVAGSSDTWAIVVHGRGVDRTEGLRVLPVLAALGLPTLVIQYRNDDGVAGTASGFYDYGLSEWRDLEAAARYALGHGANDIVLFGYSMGGGIIASFLYRSALADRVRGVVFDSPMLDFGDTVDFGAERQNIPSVLARLGKAVFALRHGISWRDLDYTADADELNVPILLIHGDADQTVPIRTSDRFAAARPDLVTYLRLEDVDHVRGWNVDRNAYEAALTDFLSEKVGIDESSPR